MTKKGSRNTPGGKVLTISELARVSGVRYGTIKFYTELGILPFEQAGARQWRYYRIPEALERLKEIQRLKARRLTVEEIVKHFKKKVD